MKLIVAVALFATAFAAPAEEWRDKEWRETDTRMKKSTLEASIGGNSALTPVSLFLASENNPTQQAIARENELNDPTFQKVQSSARSYYESGPIPGLAHAIAGPAGYGAGGAVGLFPGAKVSACAIPLLLSCSPNVVSGHLSHSGGYGAAPSYRAADIEEQKREMRESNGWVKRGVSHHKVSDDFPETTVPKAGSHHSITQDYPEPNLVRISTTLPHNQ